MQVYCLKCRDLREIKNDSLVKTRFEQVPAI